ncbi:hypothetical protein GCM10026983_43080 [Gracilibacillus alcaliphilus]
MLKESYPIQSKKQSYFIKIGFIVFGIVAGIWMIYDVFNIARTQDVVGRMILVVGVILIIIYGVLGVKNRSKSKK